MGIRNQADRQLKRSVNSRTEVNEIIPGLISATLRYSGLPLPTGHPGKPGSRDRGYGEKCHKSVHRGKQGTRGTHNTKRQPLPGVRRHSQRARKVLNHFQAPSEHSDEQVHILSYLVYRLRSILTVLCKFQAIFREILRESRKLCGGPSISRV